MKRLVTTLIAGGAATAVVVGLVVIQRTPSDRAVPPQADNSAGRQAESPVGPALDDVPGLGSSKAGLERDEIISYWEAWRRDTLTAECMSEAGFEWRPQVLYPDDSVVAVARALDVPVGDPPSPPPTPPEDANAAIEAALDSVDRNSYLVALTGETAKDTDYARRNEQVPEGRDAATFAEGGCRGDAKAAVGSVWDLERSLGQDLFKLRSSAQQTADFRAGQAAYRDCVAGFGYPGIDGPDELEEFMLSSQEARKRYAEIDGACLPSWQAANEDGQRATEASFRADNQAAIQRQFLKYVGAVDRIRVDEGFQKFLAAAAAVAAGRIN